MANLSDRELLEVLEWWIENTSKIGQVPEKYKGKIDSAKLMMQIAGEGGWGPGTKYFTDFYSVKDKIRERIPEAEKAEAMSNPYVFICHRFKDKGIARVVADYLDSGDIDYFLDERSIEYVWTKEIEEALLKCTHFIITLTKNFEEAKTAYQELGYAMGLRKLRGWPEVKAIKFDDCKIPEILSDARLQYEDITARDSYEVMKKIMYLITRQEKEVSKIEFPRINYKETPQKMLKDMLANTIYVKSKIATLRGLNEYEIGPQYAIDEMLFVKDFEKLDSWLESKGLRDEYQILIRAIKEINIIVRANKQPDHGILSTQLERLGDLERVLMQETK